MGMVVAIVRSRAGDHLPTRNAQGTPAVYALYRSEESGKPTPLLRSRTLHQSGIVNGTRLYLAERGKHWWVGCSLPSSSPAPSGGQTIRLQTAPITGSSDTERTMVVSPSPSPYPHHPTSPPRSVPCASPPVPPAVVPTAPPPTRSRPAPICHLHIATNCPLTVPPEGLYINRDYLIRNLPRHIVATEKARRFMGFNSRLNRVSRKEHCHIFCQSGVWILSAIEPTYINGRTIKGGTAVSLPRSTTIILGNDGWPVDIEIQEP